MNVKCKKFENFGHPWDRREGWHMLRVLAETPEDMRLAIKSAKSKGWDLWIGDKEEAWFFKLSEDCKIK